MVILGFDPGMLRLGFGCVETKGNEIVLKTEGMFYHPRDPHSAFNQYLNEGIHQIANDLPYLLGILSPDIIVSETVPVGRLGSNTELVVAAITVCKTIAFQFGIDWKDIGANTIKKEFTGDDKATKAKVKNTALIMFPTLDQRHADEKKNQKKAGEKATGLPQDVFDGVAVAVVGAKLYGN